MAAVVNPVRPQTPHIRGRRHRRGLLLVVPALLTAAISGTLSATLPPLTSSIDGTNINPIAGDLAHTLPPLTSALDGTVPITGTFASTLPPLTSSLDGAVLPPPIAGDLALALGPVALDSASVSARSTFRLSLLQPRIVGRRHRKGVLWMVAPRVRDDTAAWTLPPVTLAATGVVTTTPIFGQMDPRAPRGAMLRKRALVAAQQAQGRRIVVGFQYAPLAVVPTTDINLTVPPLVLSATGTVSPPVTGTLIQTLPPLTHAATSLVEITGTLAATLPPLTSAEVAFTDRTGTLAHTLPPLALAASGAVVATDGTLLQALPPVALAVTGTNPDVFGQLNLTLAQLVVTTYVPAPRFGVLTIDLPSLTLSLTGATLVASIDGQLVLTVPSLGWVGYGPAGAFGDLAFSLPALALQLQQTDFASLRFTGVGDQCLYLVGVGDQVLVVTGDGEPIAYLLRGVDP